MTAPRLPLLISVPHAGLAVPPEAEPYCVLTAAEIEADGDEAAADIYWPLEQRAEAFATTRVARAIVDLNRAEEDRRKDGVVKTHTCWDVPVYEPFPPEPVIESLLERHYRPYHRRLTALAEGPVRLGVDCHTMSAFAPPVAPDPGRERPPVCLSHAGFTCPDEWIAVMAECFAEQFGERVAINDPFQGGYIVRSHAAELPWVQLELSRAPFVTPAQKGRCVQQALEATCRRLGFI